MDENIIIADIKKFIETNILAGDITLDAESILQNVGIDSFSMIEILLFIQEKYNMLVPDDQLIPENFKTMASLARMVNKLSV
ncbi:MAG: phosphopantetheine-binding protein [Bacteroidota bacterium]|nr:phosphopantetheine-binding protein [Bacteroidota bacterium]MDP4212320.1 phosphopantetheine-binding protein [Bacteroidota bacterium]MDP4251246.1 phosphopantetheine-binding protein [Bacteroidota bacterium]